MNLATAFASAAAQHAKKTAVFWGDQEHSYEVVLAQSRQLARHLQQALGVNPGDRVGLWLRNCPEFISTLFAVFQAGAVVVPINNFLKREEVHHILVDAGIDVLITDATVSEQVAGLKVLRPQLAIWNVEEYGDLGNLKAPQLDRKSKIQNPESADLAIILYTS